ncbi:hypothetical protein QM012_005262 [Aureobasidium pullulans]|uniref:Uncharacterized protein n=1 Tax=Aureobasidium pullulans TaxID=5580 RepID=A0ABR0T6E8_AURPU
MEQTRRVNRGLRYLCLDQYKDSSPELVAANIIKLRLLQSFDLSVVHLPAHPGFPHDGAVRIPQDPLEPERLIWFDFMVLLEDKVDTATRYGTITMAQAGNTSPPAFYIVIFPSSPGYMAIVPHAVAWRERESDSFDIIGTGITGPYFPYLMPEHLISLALSRISMIPWGSLYINPGTGVVFSRWFPVMTESPRDSPTVPLIPGVPSLPLLPSSNSAGKRRRRESDSEKDSVRPAPALRELQSFATIPPVEISDPETNANWLNESLFDIEWPVLDQSVLSVLPGTTAESLHEFGIAEGQQPLENIYPALPDIGIPSNNAGGGLGHIGYGLPETWFPDVESIDKGVQRSGTLGKLLPPTQVGPATTVHAQQSRPAANLRAIAPAPLAVDAGPSHISSAVALADPPSDPHRSSPAAVSSSEADITGSEPENDDDEADAPPRRLIELHPEHPWCNHIYLPPSTRDILTQLLAPDTICLPVITNPSDTIDGKPMPLSVLSIPHPCLHVLSSRFSPDTFFLLPSRWVDFFHCSLTQLLNSTQGETKKSALRGANKIVTENPTVRDAFKRYGVRGVVGAAALSWGLWDEWMREFRRKVPTGMTREEDRNACCSVREVLQVQVDWSMRMFPDMLL